MTACTKPYDKTVAVAGQSLQIGAKILPMDNELFPAIEDKTYKAKAERIIKIKVTAWDVNCPQHIQKRYT